MVLGTALNDRYDNANYGRCPSQLDRSRKTVKHLYIVEIALISVCRFWGIYAVLGKNHWRGRGLTDGRAAFGGVVLGLLIGHMFDKARSRKMAWFANQRERQALFLPPLLK